VGVKRPVAGLPNFLRRRHPAYRDNLVGFFLGSYNAEKTRFWVFVDLKAIDLGKDAPHFYIVPAVRIESHIHKHFHAHLKKLGLTREQRHSRHTSIAEDEIRDWRNRWDLLGLSDLARF
jgi:hypothetical protein